MRKFKYLLLTILSLFILIATGITGARTSRQRTEVGPHGLRMINLTEEAKDIVLEDFDYLAYEIIENAAVQGVFYRRFGLTLEAYLNEIRDRIYDMEPVESVTSFLIDESWEEEQTEARYIAADYLISVLFWDLSMDINGLGHFGPQMRDLYVDMFHAYSISLYNSSATDFTANIERNLGYLSEPATLWLYDVDPSEFNLNMDSSDFIGVREENNITTEYLSDDIAYIHIASFINNPDFDSEILFPFYEKVQYFEHLIIDIRGNRGGWGHYVTRNVVAMLIDEPLEFRYAEFSTSGERAQRAAQYSLYGNIIGATAAEIIPATEFIEEYKLAYFNEDDLEFLEYAILFHGVIEPAYDNTPFAGEIWLLIDEETASASEFLAMLSLYSGFATVVGEPTAGITGVETTFVALPNTGVLFRVDTGSKIDALGRSVEEFGVHPSILIEPRNDALDTVLDLIQ